MDPAPRIAFQTVGCRLNQAETGELATTCREAGLVVVPYGAPCDVLVVQTCTITANAERDSIRIARKTRRASPHATIVLVGCAVEVDAERIRERSGADLVLNQREKWRLVEHLNMPRSRRPPTAADTVSPAGRTRGLLRIQDGCNFGCAYCIVPTARHKLWSRPLAEIVDAAHRLVDDGYREVVLTGANLGCYQCEDHGLLHVLEALEHVEGLERLRLSSIELTTAEQDVMHHMASSPTLCASLHIPLQSGSDRILAAMGRRYTRDMYRTQIETACQRIPDLGLGTDIIVGFPGETDDDFAQSCEIVDALPFSNLHVFTFSPRPGTRAADVKDDVPGPVKKQRAAELIARGRAKRHAFAEHFVDREVDVLIETITDGIGRGWTREYVEAHIMSGSSVNQIVMGVPSSADNGVLRIASARAATP